MVTNEGQTYDISANSEEEKWDEEWEVILNTGGKYPLNKLGAWGLRQEIANGNRGIVLFQSFSIPIPYIAEFYRVRRFLKDTYQLPAKASEKPYEPISSEKWEEFKKKVYGKIGT